MKITVRMRCAGSYEIDTPSGTYRLIRSWYSQDDAECAGLISDKWLLQNPGEYSADSDFTTKRDAVTYVRTIEREKIMHTCCPAHGVKDERGKHACALVLPKCGGGERYGVWDEGAGGFTLVVDCAMQAANWAAEQLNEDPDGELSIVTECRYHQEQIAGQCEICDQEECEDD